MIHEEKKTARKGIAAAVTCNTIFGLSFLFSKVALAETTPAILLTLRFGTALAVMGVLVPFRLERVDLRGKPLGKLLLLGLCQPVLYFICESYGIKYTNASFAGMMIALIPVLAALFSALFLHEALKISKLLWILASVLGVGIISVSESAGGVIKVIGIVWMCGAVLVASAFSVLSSSLAERFTAFERTFVMMVLGFLFFFALAIAEKGEETAAAFAAALQTTPVILSVLFLAIFSSVIAFFFQNISISALNVQRAMVFANLAPIVSVAAGVLLLHEPFSVIHVIGMGLILISIWKVNQKEKDLPR